MSTHNLCFHVAIRKIICGYPSYLELCSSPFKIKKSYFVCKLRKLEMCLAYTDALLFALSADSDNDDMSRSML